MCDLTLHAVVAHTTQMQTDHDTRAPGKSVALCLLAGKSRRTKHMLPGAKRRQSVRSCCANTPPRAAARAAIAPSRRAPAPGDTRVLHGVDLSARAIFGATIKQKTDRRLHFWALQVSALVPLLVCESARQLLSRRCWRTSCCAVPRRRQRQHALRMGTLWGRSGDAHSFAGTRSARRLGACPALTAPSAQRPYTLGAWSAAPKALSLQLAACAFVQCNRQSTLLLSMRSCSVSPGAVPHDQLVAPGRSTCPTLPPVCHHAKQSPRAKLQSCTQWL